MEVTLKAIPQLVWLSLNLWLVNDLFFSNLMVILKINVKLWTFAFRTAPPDLWSLLLDK